MEKRLCNKDDIKKWMRHRRKVFNKVTMSNELRYEDIKNRK